MVIWLTGLSGSGKSTLSACLKEVLEKAGFSVFQLDGDIFREKNNKKNEFAKKDILDNNYNIISYCQKAKKDYDFIIVSAISPYQETRDKARKIFNKKYLEIFLNCPLDILIKNDIKGLYKKAKTGEIKNLIGFSENSPYEIPKNSDLEIMTDKVSIEDSLGEIIKILEKKYEIKL
ncbi:MAG: adenylyl-sulfate kinase [Candidatus Staskawiczbacteria bacterium]|nr:adenylyl-sulfate kinase [Candidatus Staskawiczbacteria bacterium]